MPGPQLIDYTPNPSAVAFHESHAQVKALMGPVGSGKSSAWMFEFIMLCSEATVPVRGLVLRQSWPELRDSTIKTWLEWFPEPLSVWKLSDRQMHITLPGPDGVMRDHTMDFRHARNAAEATRFLSTEYGFICLEECAPAFEVGRAVIGAGIPEEIFQVAQMRQRQKGLHRLHLVCIFNPPSKRHWTYKTFVGPSETEKGRETLARKDYAFFAQPPFENRDHLPPRYYERLLEQLSQDLADRFVHGKPVTVYPGMPVYPEIKEDYHVLEYVAPLKGVGLVTGHDFGRTPYICIAQVTETQIRFLREIQLWGASSEKAVEVMQRVLKDDFPDHEWMRGWGDPAGQNPTETDDKTSFSIFAAKGFPLRPGAETLAARKEAIKQRAGRNAGMEPAFLVSATGCPMLAEALLGGYRYGKSGDGQLSFHPLKNDYSHSANGAEYVTSGEFSHLDGSRQVADAKRLGMALIPKYNPLGSERPGGGGSWMSG